MRHRYLRTVMLLLLALYVGGTLAASSASRHRSLDADSHLYLPVLSRPHAPTDGQPSWSAPIAVSPADGSVWVVNPDANTVTVLDGVTHDKAAEIPTGAEPWALAIAPDGSQVYVANRAGGTLSIIDTAGPYLEATVPVGHDPVAVALSPDGRRAYVAQYAAAAVTIVATQEPAKISQISVDSFPYGLAITDDGDGESRDEQILVSHHLSRPRPGYEEATDDGRIGQVTLFSPQSGTSTTVPLLANAQGFPSLLTSVTLQSGRAYLPHVRAAPDLPNSLTTTVFAAVSAIDVANAVEEPAAYLPLNDQEHFASPVNNPVMAVPSPDGRYLYVVLAGSGLVEIVDVTDPTRPQLEGFLPAGHNPRGMALGRDGRFGYVMNYLSRSVTILDLTAGERIAEVTTTEETLPADILRGKILFHQAADPRLSRGSWFSCASCHPHGASDGITWRFPDGPRQTPALWNAGQTLPWHWSAALDEPQDVETTIETIQHGLGLAPGDDPRLLGAPNAGRSADLDALAAFLTEGIRAPSVPPATSALDAGRALFRDAGCARCHGGPTWTVSQQTGPAGTLDPDGNGMVDAALYDVGTVNPLDVRGATGFDVPSLLGAGLTPPYLHDGSMPTVAALLASGHPQPTTGSELTEEEIKLLAEFVRSIGPHTPPVEPEVNNP